MDKLQFRLVIALLAMIAAIGFMGKNDVGAAEEYHLGVALGTTGVGASYCKDGVDAIALAVEEINSAGGLLGKYPIKLFIQDTQTKADVAVKVVRELIHRDRVRCILGTYGSDEAIAIKPICRENKVLHIAAISNSENLTKLDFSPYTYSVVPNSYMQARAVALGVARMAKRYNWKDYVTIASDYEWGRSTQASFVKLLKEVAPEIQLKKEYWPSQGEKDFGPLIKAIMDDKPGFAYGCLAAQDSANWINQANQQGFFGKVPYPGSLISVWELINHAKTQPRGMIGLCRAPFFAHMNVPAMADFVKAFRAKYNRYPSDWAVLEYDAVSVLKQGIEKAKSIDTDAVKEALKGMTVRTTRGELSFRPIDNQLSCSSYLGRVSDDDAYPFPIYTSIIEIKGPESWRPESEIMAARQAEKK